MTICTWPSARISSSGAGPACRQACPFRSGRALASGGRNGVRRRGVAISPRLLAGSRLAPGDFRCDPASAISALGRRCREAPEFPPTPPPPAPRGSGAMSSASMGGCARACTGRRRAVAWVGAAALRPLTDGTDRPRGSLDPYNSSLGSLQPNHEYCLPVTWRNASGRPLRKGKEGRAGAPTAPPDRHRGPSVSVRVRGLQVGRC